jgi:hypothetical protein
MKRKTRKTKEKIDLYLLLPVLPPTKIDTSNKEFYAIPID